MASVYKMVILQKTPEFTGKHIARVPFFIKLSVSSVQFYLKRDFDTSEIFKNTFSINTAQKRKFSIKDFFSKCDQILRSLRIWSHLLIKYLMENFLFCVVKKLPGDCLWQILLFLQEFYSDFLNFFTYISLCVFVRV